MARCMLCSTVVGDTEVVCPRCGGAVEASPADATHVHGVDLTKVDGPPSQWGTPVGDAPPAGSWPTPGPGQPGPVPPGYSGAPGYASPPGYGAPPGYAGFPAYGGYGAAPGWGGYRPPPQNEGLALASFLTSLIGLVTAFLCGFPILACPVGAVLGHVALRRIEENGKQGRGLALAGIIIGWIATALVVLGTVTFIAIVVASGSSAS